MTLKITILVPQADETLSFEKLERTVACDVLGWVNSDESGLDVPGARVKVERAAESGREPGRFFETDYHQTGEGILEVD